MKVLVVDQYYYPEQFQVNDICEQMVKNGHQVTVLTGLPNYPTGIVPEEYKHGKKRDEWINGVHVLRCFEIGRKKGALGMIMNYASFVISGAIKQFKLERDFDLVFIYETSPVTLAYPAVLYARRRKKPLFFYCCDIWPECARVMVHNDKSLLYKLIARISRYLYRRSDILAVQSEGFFDYFKTIHGIEERRLRYLPQFASSEYMNADFTPVDNGVIDFVFLGNIGIAQDIGGLLRAVEFNRDLSGFHVHLVGGGSYLDEAKSICKQKGLESLVTFYGRRPYEEMTSFYKLADVCMATLQSDSLLNLTMPSKVQGYMAAGKPILAAVCGKSRDIIEQNKCGLCVTPGNSEELAHAMREYILHYDQYMQYGLNARKVFKENFTFEIFMKRLYSQIDDTVRIWREQSV